MAIAYRGAGAVTTVTGSGTISPALPAGWQEGDLMILLVANYDDVTAEVAPTGWSPLAPVNFAPGDGFSALCYRRALSTDTAPAVPRTGGTVKQAAGVVAFSGASPSGNPFILGTKAQGTGTTVTATAVDTTGYDNAAVLFFTSAFVGSAVSASAHSGTLPTFVEIVDGGGSNVNMSLAWGLKASAGSTGSRTATLSASSDWATILVALKEEVAGAALPNNMKTVA